MFSFALWPFLMNSEQTLQSKTKRMKIKQLNFIFIKLTYNFHSVSKKCNKIVQDKMRLKSFKVSPTGLVLDVNRQN